MNESKSPPIIEVETRKNIIKEMAKEENENGNPLVINDLSMP